MSQRARSRRRPPGPRGQALLGVAPEIQRDFLGLLEHAATYGDVVRLPLPGTQLVFVNHPDHVRRILVDRQRSYGRERVLQSIKPLLGEGLLTSEGGLHHRQRRLIQPAFLRERVAGYAETITACTQRHIASWSPGDERDLHDELMQLTMTIVAQTLFGTSVEERAGELGATLNRLMADFRFYEASPVGRLLRCLPTRRNWRRGRSHRRLKRVVLEMVLARRSRGPGAAGCTDLLDELLGAVDREPGGKGGMSDAQARDEVMTLFVAGHETTANALSWTLYLLALHTEVDRALGDEACRVLGERVPTFADVERLELFRCVISESMRLYPPAWGIGRTALEPDEIGGFPIRRGGQVFCAPWILHRDPRWWDEPLAFRPERFSPQNEARHVRHAYVPFGAGPRRCIGESFARAELVLVLATLLRRFSFALAPGARVVPEPVITLRLAHGLPMVLGARP